VKSVYDIERPQDAADLIVCCEVLEHVDAPERALEAIARVAERDVILSVPREPLWRVLNMARGKYISQLGNTPGHLNHWSSRGFVEMAQRYFDVIAVRKPVPWTMLHCRVRTRGA
jgi:ubiquinone/menaquinone biosynthesis C-methylase UbiE